MELTPEHLRLKAESLIRAPVEQQNQYFNLVFHLNQIGHITHALARELVSMIRDSNYNRDNE